MLKKTLVPAFFLFTLFFTATGVVAEPSENTGSDLGSVLGSMIKGEAEFPPRFKTVSQPLIADPDLSVKVRSTYLDKIIAAYLKNPIPLEQDGALSKSYFTAKKAFVKTDPQRNVLIVHVMNGTLNLSGSLSDINGTLTVNKAEFEVAPLCRKDGRGQVILDLDIRCVDLDIDGAPDTIDIGVAHLLQDQYLNKHPVQPLFLTELFRSYTSETGKFRLENILTQLAVIISADGIEFRTRWNVK
jgi:hypothetical protein